MTTNGPLKALELIRDGKPVTVLDHIKAAFTIDGQAYKVRLSGAFAKSYELHRGEATVALAKGEAFINRLTITCGDKTWLLKPETMSLSRFGLFDGETRIGEITKGGWLRSWKGAGIDLPNTVPLEVQVFLFEVALAKWTEGSSAD
jgi:hypothetical protein